MTTFYFIALIIIYRLTSTAYQVQARLSPRSFIHLNTTVITPYTTISTSLSSIKSSPFNITLNPKESTEVVSAETYHALTPEPSLKPIALTPIFKTLGVFPSTTIPRTSSTIAIASATTSTARSFVSNELQFSNDSPGPSTPRPFTSSDGPNEEPQSLHQSSVLFTPPSSTELDIGLFSGLRNPSQPNESPANTPHSPPPPVFAVIATQRSSNPSIESTVVETITLGSQTYGAVTSGSDVVETAYTLSSGFTRVDRTIIDTSFGSETSITIPREAPTPGSLPSQTPDRLTLGDTIYTANSLHEFVIDSQTLRPNGPEITISGTPISLLAELTRTAVRDGPYTIAGSTNTLLRPSSLPTLIATSDMEPGLLIIGSQSLTANGNALTISGKTFALAIAPITSTVGPTATPDPNPTTTSIDAPFTILPFPSSTNLIDPKLITIANSIYTANAASAFVIGTQTLSPGGPAITASGIPVSLAPGNTEVYFGGSSSTQGLAGLIMSGVGGNDYDDPAAPASARPTGNGGVNAASSSALSSSATSNGTVFEGSARQIVGTDMLVGWEFWVSMILVCISVGVGGTL